MGTITAIVAASVAAAVSVTSAITSSVAQTKQNEVNLAAAKAQTAQEELKRQENIRRSQIERATESLELRQSQSDAITQGGTTGTAGASAQASQMALIGESNKRQNITAFAGHIQEGQDTIAINNSLAQQMAIRRNNSLVPLTGTLEAVGGVASAFSGIQGKKKKKK